VLPVLELDPRTGDKEGNCGRRDQLVGSGLLHDSSCDVDRNAADVLATLFYFPGVQPRPDRDPQWGEGISKSRRTSDCPARAVKGCEHSVTSELHEPSTVLVDDGVGECIVGFQRTYDGPS